MDAPEPETDDSSEIESFWQVAKVRAKPEAGKANDAVLALLAGALDVGISRLRLLRGATSREKCVQLPPA